MGEVKGLPLAQGQGSQAGAHEEGCWERATPGVPVSPISDSARKGAGHFSPLPPFGNISESEKSIQDAVLFSSFSLMCLLGKFPLPLNGSLITDAHYTTNMYFANERWPPWRSP